MDDAGCKITVQRVGNMDAAEVRFQRVGNMDAARGKVTDG
jgi:hypothetical protein